MSVPQILEEHKDELIIRTREGKITTIPNDPYTIVKKMFFNEKQILYPFDDYVSANETFNDRIFNLTYGKYEITSRPNQANAVCQAIIDHRKKGDYLSFRKLFLDSYSEDHVNELVIEYITGLNPNIKYVKEFKHNTGKIEHGVFIVGNRFAIDSQNGNHSWYFREADETWEHLCTVIESAMATYKVKVGDVGWAKIDNDAAGVIAKTAFFLRPRATDKVFMDQIRTASPVTHQEILTGEWHNKMEQKV